MKNVIISKSLFNLLSSVNLLEGFIIKPNTEHYIISSFEINDKGMNYFSYRVDSSLGLLISFIPKGKEQKFNDDGRWCREGRQTMKIGKFLNILGVENKLIETKVNELKSLNNSVVFKELDASHIKQIYDAGTDGWHHTSCMSGKSEFLDLYENNPEVFSILVAYKGTEIVGRGLIVNTDEGVMVYDRFYSKYSEIEQNFINYVGEGVRKSSQSLGSSFSDGCEYSITINNDFDSYDYFPYVDSFKYAEINKDSFYLKTNCDSYYDYSLDCTNGSYSGDDRVYCEDTGCFVDADLCTYVDSGEHQYRDLWFYSENVVCVNDDYFHIDDNNIININDSFYLIDDCCYSEYHDEYFHEDEHDFIYSSFHSDYFLSDYLYYCDDINEYVLEDYCIKATAGEYEDQYILEENSKKVVFDGVEYIIHEDDDEEAIINELQEVA